MSVSCISCKADAEPGKGEVYDLFVIQRYGTRNDQIGSKFFFYCPACKEAVCKTCLNSGKHELKELEYNIFACPRCSGRLYPVKMDNRSEKEAEEAITGFLQGVVNPSLTEGKIIITIPEKSIEWISFCSGVLMTVSEGMEFRFKSGENDFKLIHFRYPEPFSVLFEKGEECLIERKSLIVRPGFSVTADNEGFYFANTGSGDIEIEKRGVVKITYDYEKGRGSSIADVKPVKNAKRDMLRNKLREISGMRIWDYQFINTEETEGKGEIHIAGSTDLIYYHIAELYFKKVKFSNLISYFHHPLFELAEGAAEEQVRLLAEGADKDDFVFSVHTDKGGFNEKRYFIAAKHLFAEIIKNK